VQALFAPMKMIFAEETQLDDFHINISKSYCSGSNSSICWSVKKFNTKLKIMELYSINEQALTFRFWFRLILLFYDDIFCKCYLISMQRRHLF